MVCYLKIDGETICCPNKFLRFILRNYIRIKGIEKVRNSGLI